MTIDRIYTKTELKRPTRAMPGSEEKLELMTQRTECGMSCFVAGDRQLLDQNDDEAETPLRERRPGKGKHD